MKYKLKYNLKSKTTLTQQNKEVFSMSNTPETTRVVFQLSGKIQNIVDKALPFCRFKYSYVLARWNVMTEMASNVGIQIIGFFLDVDKRLLKAMKIKVAKQRS